MNNLEERLNDLRESIYDIHARLGSSTSTTDAILLMLVNISGADTNILQECSKVGDVVQVLREYIAETAERCDVMDNGLSEVMSRFTPQLSELLKIYFEELTEIDQARLLVYADKLRQEVGNSR